MMDAISSLSAYSLLNSLQGTSAATTSSASQASFDLSDVLATSEVAKSLSSSNLALSPEILSLLQEATSTDPLASLLGTEEGNENDSVIAQLLE